MTRQRDLKRRIRDRMRETGEPYTLARVAVVPVTDQTPRGDDVTMTDDDDRPALPPVSSAIPRLSSGDLDRTLAFYTAIGFRERARYDDYLVLVRDTIELHFSQWDIDPLTNNSAVFVRVADADAFYADIRAGLPDLSHDRDAIPRVKAPLDVAWGGRELAVIDPFGNLLVIGESGTES
jgi:catechol 2,3-dioxygenase-like lactoylglutathione lyase family enzyme